MNQVAVLAGGSGTRLGGIDKGLMKVGGLTLVERLIDTLRGFDTVIVCKDKREQDYYTQYSKVIEDEFKGGGPLAGIHAALKHFKTSIMVVGVDMPFVRRDVVECLMKEFSRKSCEAPQALIPVWKDGKTEPLLACYNYSIIDRIESNLKRGDKKIINALDIDKVKLFTVERLKEYDEELLSFVNINTPEDVKKVEEICSRIDSGERLPT
ncbi:MAG: molybdenum cofactor guanylyltransferase [Archaeoglobaceae archaeon]